jgi:hypothetical protein
MFVGMGYDINTFIEVYNDKEAKWEYHDTPNPIFDYRNYNLYTFLCGYKGISKEKNIIELDYDMGLPSDVSDYVKISHREDYGYALITSNLLFSRLAEFDYDDEFVNNEGESVKYKNEFGERFFSDLEYISSLHKDSDKIRLVFWFT